MANKVIIYDDDLDLLEVCSFILQAKQYDVVTRDRCSEILKDVEEHRPDVVIMDNWIPDIGGVKATRLLKASEFRHIPVIFFSANNNVSELAAQAGADYSLQKPFDIEVLENLVSEALSVSSK